MMQDPDSAGILAFYDILWHFVSFYGILWHLGIFAKKFNKKSNPILSDFFSNF